MLMNSAFLRVRTQTSWEHRQDSIHPDESVKLYECLFFIRFFPPFRSDQTSIAIMDDEELDEIPFGVDGADLVPDSETEDRDRLELRAEALGFRPQKEVIHNFLLPYSDKVQSCFLLWIYKVLLSL